MVKTAPTAPITSPEHPVIDAYGAYGVELEMGNLPVPGFVIGDSVERRKTPRCRTTPLGGEPLPAPVPERIPVDVQEVQNRSVYVLSLLLIVAASPVVVVCAAILLGGIS